MAQHLVGPLPVEQMAGARKVDARAVRYCLRDLVRVPWSEHPAAGEIGRQQKHRAMDAREHLVQIVPIQPLAGQDGIEGGRVEVLQATSAESNLGSISHLV